MHWIDESIAQVAETYQESSLLILPNDNWEILPSSSTYENSYNESTKVQTLHAYHSTTNLWLILSLCIYWNRRAGKELKCHSVGGREPYMLWHNLLTVRRENIWDMHSLMVKCASCVSITVCRARNGPVPVNFLASYWPSASAAGLWSNAQFTSCSSSSFCASLISEVYTRKSSAVSSNSLAIGFFTPVWRQNFWMQYFQENRLFNIHRYAGLRPLVSLVGRLVAWGDRIVVTDRHTDTQTHRPSTVTLAAHAHRGLINRTLLLLINPLANLPLFIQSIIRDCFPEVVSWRLTVLLLAIFPAIWRLCYDERI